METAGKLSASYVVIGVKEKIGYGFGDFASNLSFGFVSLFLLFFYTNIYGISAVQASLIFVIARVVDAAFNILIGFAIDKTHSRYGKLRPWLLYGSIPLGFLTVLCFVPFGGEAKFYFALISYTIYCLAYTAVNTPYSALTKERVGEEEEETPAPTLREMLKAVAGNAPLINLSMFTVFFYIAYTVWMAIAIYFIKYIIGSEGFTSTFFMIQSAAYIVGTVISEKIIALIGKKKMTLVALLIGIAGVLMQYFIAGDNIWLIMTGVCLYSITLGMGFVSMWSMIADTVEYAEWHHGVRTEGAIYGFFNFITKIAMAIGGGCAGWMLDYYHYDAGNITASAINGINVLMTLFPGAMFALSALFVACYSLDEKTYRDIVQKISLRKQNAL